MYIVFEGVDGIGKTQQAELLRKHFGKKGLICSENKSSAIGAELAAKQLSNINNLTIAEIIDIKHVQRMAMLTETAIPYAQLGGKIIIDRFTESTKAYTKAMGATIKDNLLLAEKEKRIPILPGRIDILLHPVDFLTHKALEENDPFESRGTAFMENVKANFLDQFLKHPCGVIINVTQQMDAMDVHKHILNALKDRNII